jgi:bacterioferritin (cytochrome b1)
MNDTVLIAVTFVNPPTPDVVQQLRERIMGLESLPMIADVGVLQSAEEEPDDLPSLVEDVREIKAMLTKLVSHGSGRWLS